MIIWYKFYSSNYFSFFFIYFFKHYLFFLSFFVCFCTFIWLQGDLKNNWTKIIFYFLSDSNLFYVLSIKDNHFFTIIINYLILFIFLLLVQFHQFVIISFFFFLMKHIFTKIILNIYFDHIHIMCLYWVFSVHCTGYTLVIYKRRKHER